MDNVNARESDQPGFVEALRRIDAALKGETAALTPSGRMLAAYLRENLATIPFETGASIAAKTGVSEMTVIRNIRGLGYASLKELKHALRSPGANTDDVLDRFHVRRDDLGDLKASLELELRAVMEAYQFTRREQWNTVVELLAYKSRVNVAGFQATKGVALDFSTRFKYARSGVRFVEGNAGVYSEVLESDPDESCLVLVDTVAYARQGVSLARKARARQIPLVIVTDRFSNWAYEFTDLVLQGSTNVRTFWDSTSSLSVILNLLTNSVAIKLGDKALERFQFMKELGRHFKAFEPSSQTL